jgi:hypothetical protein
MCQECQGRARKVKGTSRKEATAPRNRRNISEIVKESSRNRPGNRALPSVFWSIRPPKTHWPRSELPPRPCELQAERHNAGAKIGGGGGGEVLRSEMEPIGGDESYGERATEPTHRSRSTFLLVRVRLTRARVTGETTFAPFAVV